MYSNPTTSKVVAIFSRRCVLYVLSLLLIGLVFGVAGRHGWAVEYYWDGDWNSPPHGIFNVDANWNSDLVPGGSDLAIFSLGAMYTVTFDNSPITAGFDVRAGDVTFTGDGTSRTYTLTADAKVDGGDLSIDDLAVDLASDFFVGDTSSGTLTVQNGGAVSNMCGYIGNDSYSHGTVSVDGAGSTWNNSWDLVVGHFGTGQLSIQNGGAVSNMCGYIGNGSYSHGTVSVDGAGSTWTNSQNLYVGGGGAGTLTVQNDGTVDVAGMLRVWHTGTVELLGSQINAGAFIIESGGMFTHQDGTLTVDGGPFDPGTGLYIINGAAAGDLPTIKLINSATTSLGGELQIGRSHAGALEVRSGGTISNTFGWIGCEGGSSGTMIVDGSGSTWTNSDYLEVGYDGTGQLSIQNGGAVSNTIGCIGHGSYSHGMVSVDGAGSTWTNSSELYVGYGGTGQLSIQNGAAVSNTSGFIGYHSGPNNAVTVDGAGSTWTNYDQLCVGLCGVGQLSIENGGAVSNTDGYIGKNSGSNGTVSIDGAGSTWTNSQNLYVGGDNSSAGGTGTLTVQNDGTVDVAGTLMVWNTGTVYLLGSQINSGSFIVSGGIFAHQDGTLTVDGGTFYPGTSSSYTIDGAAAGDLPTIKLINSATTSLSNELTVGGSHAAALEVRSGGAVSNTFGYIGRGYGSNGTVSVDGIGSTWNSGELCVGYDGTGQLSIQNGGAVSNTYGYIGRESGSHGTVSIDGAGSTWTNGQNLYVGGNNSSPGGTGTLTVQNDGTVVVGTLKVWNTGTLNFNGGTIETGSLDMVEITDFNWTAGTLNLTNTDLTIETGANPFGASLTVGADKTLGVSGWIEVGDTTTGTLNITAGGAVSNTAAYIGFNTYSNGTVTVTGTGSTWTNSEGLVVGSGGTGQLSIQNGGAVSNTFGCIGDEFWSNSTATVDGTDSTWTNSGELLIGHMGTGQLSIQNGGSVSNTNGYIGMNGGGPSGTVTVAGIGSTWNNIGDLHVGHYGAGQLSIQNGGAASSHTGYIGRFSGSEGTVTVAGIGSTWNNSSDLSVGQEGDGMMEILYGGNVASGTSYLGQNGGSEGHAVVDGAGSAWTVHSDLYVGGNDGGSGGAGILEVSGRGSLEVAGILKVWSTGSLTVDGGDVVADSLHNYGLMRGDGSVCAPLVNYDGGTVRATTGDYLEFTGSGANTNQGQINLISATVAFASDLINEPTGMISGRGGLIFDGGMTNHGEMNFGGDTDIYGTVVNGQTGSMGTDGEIVVSGGASVAFHDDMVHNGVKLKVSPNADAAFFGQVSGAGSFTGGGGVWFEGGYSPGNSPEWVQLGVDIAYGDESTATMELAGHVANGPGDTQYDVIEIIDGHTLTLDGTLDIVLLDSFEPAFGSTFDIFRYDSGKYSGQFHTINQPTWMPGYYFEVTYADTAVTLKAVPEPSTLVLLLAGAVFLLVWRRCRKRVR